MQNKLIKNFVFGTNERVKIYESSELLIASGISLQNILEDLKGAYKLEGTWIGNLRSKAINEILQLRGGRGIDLGEAFSHIFPEDEAAVIASMAETNKPDEGFILASKIANGKIRIKNAMVSAVAYPSLLGFMALASLHIVSTEIAPMFLNLLGDTEITGVSYFIIFLGNYWQSVGIPIAIGLTLSFLFILIKLPTYIGGFRKFLDRFPPWSIYREIQGATFLMTLSGALQSGEPTPTALVRIGKSSNPWLQQRILAAKNHMGEEGKTLGQGFALSGFGFPNKDSIRYLALLSGTNDFSRSLAIYSEKSFEMTLKNVEKATMIFNGLLLAFIMGFFGSIMMAVFGLSSQMQTSM